MAKATMPPMWDVNAVQFARLLDEINAVGLNNPQLGQIGQSMNLGAKEIQNLLDRATKVWDEWKVMLNRDYPLSKDEQNRQMESGRVEGIVGIKLSNQGTDFEDQEGFLDLLSDALVGATNALSDVRYSPVFAHKGQVFFHVSGEVESLI